MEMTRWHEATYSMRWQDEKWVGRYDVDVLD